MNTKSLTKITELLDTENFDLEFEADMVQSRIVSTLLAVIDEQGLSQEDLAELTGLSQPFISGLLNIRKKLNVEHIALFQKALGIKLNPPTYLTEGEYQNKYLLENYESPHITPYSYKVDHKKRALGMLLYEPEMGYGKDKVVFNPKIKKTTKDEYSQYI